MNENYFFDFIAPYLNEKTILCKKHRGYTKQRQYLNLSIKLHMGYPCFRYCICKYVRLNDIKLIFL